MKEIDCLGDMCPVPVMKIRAVLDTILAGESYMLITDHSCSCTSIEAFCKVHQLCYEAEEVMNGIWEIKVSASK